MTQRARFSPSAYHSLHIGAARTALFNWLFTRRTGGQLILRIDDTEQRRAQDSRAKELLDLLGWLGIDGDGGPRFQSRRLQAHIDSVETLLRSGAAYRDFSPVDSRAVTRPNPHQQQTSNPWRDLLKDEAGRRASRGDPFVVRLRVDRAGPPIEYHDEVFGPQQCPRGRVEDFVLQRTDGSPTYHLATVVDDIDEQITLVMRGQEHIPSTIRQLLLYDALGVEPPKFAHLPMLERPRRGQAREGSTTLLQTYAAAGFPPSAVRNFLALLGFNPPNRQELFLDDQELISVFDLDRVARSPARVTWKKACELSAAHIASLSLEAVERLVRKQLAQDTSHEKAPWQGHPVRFGAAVELCREGACSAAEIVARGRGLFQEEMLIPDELFTHICERLPLRKILMELTRQLHSSTNQSWPEAQQAVDRVASGRSLRSRTVLYVFRVALTGTDHGPPLSAIWRLLGAERAHSRLMAMADRCGRGS